MLYNTNNNMKNKLYCPSNLKIKYQNCRKRQNPTRTLLKHLLVGYEKKCGEVW